MSKAPPGVKRIVAVLNFFAEHPGQAFTFTDIVKALDLGRATCHALLAGLVEAQYLYRNNDKTYVVGPALVAIGRIAIENFSPMQAAQPELRALSDEFRAVCSAVYLEGNDVNIKLRAGSGSHAGWSVPQGYTLPLRAPFAGAFFSASKPYDVEKWLDQLSPAVSESEKEKLRASIEFTRTHGYTFGVLNAEVPADLDRPELAFTGVKNGYPVSIETELVLDRDYQLSFLTSPVFDTQGKVDFVLNLSGHRGIVKGDRVAQMGAALLAAAERVTYFINGKSKPYPFPI